MQKRIQSWLDHHQSWLGIAKNTLRRNNIVMERQWRWPVAYSRNSTFRPICAELDGDSGRCQYAYLQLNTIDDAQSRSMTDRYFTGARQRKFWIFQNFCTATTATGAQWRSAAFTPRFCLRFVALNCIHSQFLNRRRAPTKTANV